jgi:hypothetical protein
MLQIAVECLFDTGCLFSNFIKLDTVRQLGSNILEEDDEHRHVTLADGSLTSSFGILNCNVMLRHKSHGTFSLHSICFQILTNLAFDVIIGYPCIRRYSLMSRFPSPFSETCLQVHNCTKCCQSLPGHRIWQLHVFPGRLVTSAIVHTFSGFPHFSGFYKSFIFCEIYQHLRSLTFAFYFNLLFLFLLLL